MEGSVGSKASSKAWAEGLTAIADVDLDLKITRSAITCSLLIVIMQSC